MLTTRTLIKALFLFSLLACSALSAHGDSNPQNEFINFIAFSIPLIPTEVPAIQHYAAETIAGGHEIFALYDKKTIGFILDTNKLRRPEYQHTRQNINKATVHFYYRLVLSLIPEKKGQLDEYMIQRGYDPTDQNEKMNNAAGVGNYVFNKVYDYFARDGSNQLGDEHGDTYNKRNYTDTTGYEAVNKPHFKISDIDPDKWMPLPLQLKGTFGQHVYQTYKSPQFGEMQTYAGMTQEEMDELTPDLRNLYTENPQLYKEQTLEVIRESAEIDDRKKLIGEFFDQKAVGFTQTLAAILGPDALDFKKFFMLQQAANLGFLDAFIVMWNQKTKYDAIRPETSVRYLFGERMIRAWRGPRQGVGLIKANQWKSYLVSDAFPEYPSGTSCVCHVIGAVAKKYLGKNELPDRVSFTFPQGSSIIEPGFTPKQNTTIGWNTVDDLVHDCVQSRLWGGVHFQPAIDATEQVCKEIGERNYDRALKLFNGKNPYGFA